MIVKNTDPVYRYASVKMLAPADGFVTSMEVDMLSWVDRGTKLFSITDPKSLVVDAEIPAADLHFFKIGQISKLKDGSGNSYPLVLKGLSPIVDPKTGTASVELVLKDKTEAKLRPGQIARVLFEVNPRNRIIIPESAVIFREGKAFVRLFEDGKAKRIAVKIAVNLGDRVEISEGLKPSQQLITRWSRFITDEELVEVQK
jgi:RND family efflux transporter MFP subunit